MVMLPDTTTETSCVFMNTMSYVHWNIVGDALDTPPVPYVSSDFVTSTVAI